MKHTRRRGPWDLDDVEIPALEALGSEHADTIAKIVQAPVPAETPTVTPAAVPIIKKKKPETKKPGRLRRGIGFLWSLKNPLNWPGAAWRATKWSCRTMLQTWKWTTILGGGYLASCALYLGYLDRAAPSAVFNASATCKMQLMRGGQRVNVEETFNTTYSSQSRRFLNNGRTNPAIFGDAQTPDEAIDACFSEAARQRRAMSLISAEVGTSDDYGFGQILSFDVTHYNAGVMSEARRDFLQGTREAFSGLTGYGYPNILQRGARWLFDKTGVTQLWDGAGSVATFLYPWNNSLPKVNPGAYCLTVNNDGSRDLFATRWPDKKSRPDVVTAALQPNSNIRAHWSNNVLDPIRNCAIHARDSINADAPIFSAYYGISADMQANYRFQQMGTPDPRIINSTDPKYFLEMIDDMEGLLESADLVQTERSAKSPAQVWSELHTPYTQPVVARVTGAWDVLWNGPATPHVS